MKYQASKPERLDLFLTQQLQVSRSVVKRLIQEKLVFVDGNPAKKPGQIVDANHSIELNTDNLACETVLQPSSRRLDLLFEDRYLMVVVKPAGTVTHPVTSKDEDTLVNDLLGYGCPLSGMGGELRPGIVHRLDRDTSGLMVVAKTDGIHEALKQQFQDRLVKKRYYVMVRGDVIEDEFHIAKPIGKIKNDRMKRMTVRHESDLSAKQAETFFKVIRRFGTKTLLEGQPVTGRTHQIRVHLAHKGHSVLGDGLYGRRSKSRPYHLLQAFGLRFRHPVSGEVLSFEIPIEKRMLV